ncbi:MAG TPA: ATP-binding protein [Thermoplasmatales archaeon]|nr:ATP-binding protein [Thermoplasmatales archaeon]
MVNVKYCKNIRLIMIQFVDRERELEYLNEVWEENVFQLVILYGRRRVGKTELLKKFLEDKKGAYILLTNESMRENINYIKNALADVLQEEYVRRLEVENLYDLFKLVKFGEERLVIILDEFPFLMEINPGILATFQKIVDEILSKTNVMLILCGSSLSMMEQDVIGYRSPLYGRRINIWKVQPFDFRTIYSITRDIEKAMEIYFIFGGIPYYLSFYDESLSLGENIRRNILTKGRNLYDEPLILLREEFRESRIYRLILKYLALGYRSLGKLCSVTGMDRGNLSKYLDTLRETGIVEHIIPYGKRRGGIYEISDPFMDFWFRFVYPHRAELEMGNIDTTLNTFEKEKNIYFGHKFERLMRELLAMKFFPEIAEYDSIGKWWKGEEEVDIIATGNNSMLLGECKWSEGIDAEKIIRGMKNVRGISWKGKIEYAIFAKSFKRRSQKAYIYDLKDIENILKG